MDSFSWEFETLRYYNPHFSTILRPFGVLTHRISDFVIKSDFYL